MTQLYTKSADIVLKIVGKDHSSLPLHDIPNTKPTCQLNIIIRTIISMCARHSMHMQYIYIQGIQESGYITGVAVVNSIVITNVMSFKANCSIFFIFFFFFLFLLSTCRRGAEISDLGNVTIPSEYHQLDMRNKPIVWLILKDNPNPVPRVG